MKYLPAIEEIKHHMWETGKFTQFIKHDASLERLNSQWLKDHERDNDVMTELSWDEMTSDIWNKTQRRHLKHACIGLSPEDFLDVICL